MRTARPDAALLEQLLQNFGARYENAPLCTLPAKLSVSGLVHEGAAPVLARPAFLYKEGLTAAERGTALHAALQFADLAAAANDLPGEVARLVEGGWLDAALAGQLELPRMAAFLQSPLAARMREAKKLLREYGRYAARTVRAPACAGAGHCGRGAGEWGYGGDRGL